MILQDAKTLRAARREAIRTSPGSFLTTLGDVDAKEPGYWIDEIQSSTWVVAERDGRAVGVAACKSPEHGYDEESDYDSRYIESVWIDPDLRGQRLGERLITYLMAAEFLKYLNIRQFLLWVFEKNSPAISLYERMQFVKTGDKHEDFRGDRHEDFRTEIKYRLVVNPGTSADIRRNADKIVEDKEGYGIIYRVLGEEDST